MPGESLASRGEPGIKAPDLVPERKVPNGVEYDSKPDAAPDARVPDTAAGNRGPGGSVDSPQGSASGGFQPASTGTKRVSPATTANIDMPAPTMGGACFLAGTVVETQDGLRAIETVEVGQWVAGRNEASGKTTWRRVVQTFRTEDMQALAVDVRHADGEVETIQTTTEHPFYVQDKSWCEARELSAGDRLVLIDNTLSTVVAVSRLQGCMSSTTLKSRWITRTSLAAGGFGFTTPAVLIGRMYGGQMGTGMGELQAESIMFRRPNRPCCPAVWELMH